MRGKPGQIWDAWQADTELAHGLSLQPRSTAQAEQQGQGTGDSPREWVQGGEARARSPGRVLCQEPCAPRWGEPEVRRMEAGKWGYGEAEWRPAGHSSERSGEGVGEETETRLGAEARQGLSPAVEWF